MNDDNYRSDVEPSVYHLDRPGLLKVLGELEAEIMTIIWSSAGNEGITVRDIYDQLRGRRYIAYTTVMTTMTRLAKKNLLTTVKREQTYVYHPTVNETEFTSRFVGQILDQLLTSFTSSAIAHFAELADPSKKDTVVDLLQEIVDRHKTDKPA